MQEAAAEAAHLALAFFRKSPRTWTKERGSPVSEADIAVDTRMAERLLAARPEYGWVSEERADNASRLGRRLVFVLDPIDGTREFLAGRRGWTVSIAVVEEGRPRSAVLAAPALNRTFAAVAGGGAFMNGKRLSVAHRSSLAGLRLAGPRTLLKEVAAAAGVPASHNRFVGALSLRLALVAAAEIDVAAAKAGAMDWDLAAADLVVHEAGGVMAGLDGRSLRYNRSALDHPAVFASAPGLAIDAARLISADPAGDSRTV